MGSLLYDRFPRRADDLGHAFLECLRTFRNASQHEEGLAERRGLFLQSTRIRKYEMHAFHKVDERKIVQRRNKMHAVDIREDPPDRALYLGVQVNRIYDSYVRELIYDFDQGHAYFFKVFAQCL